MNTNVNNNYGAFTNFIEVGIFMQTRFYYHESYYLC